MPPPHLELLPEVVKQELQRDEGVDALRIVGTHPAEAHGAAGTQHDWFGPWRQGVAQMGVLGCAQGTHPAEAAAERAVAGIATTGAGGGKGVIAAGMVQHLQTNWQHGSGSRVRKAQSCAQMVLPMASFPWQGFGLCSLGQGVRVTVPQLRGPVPPGLAYKPRLLGQHAANKGERTR